MFEKLHHQRIGAVLLALDAPLLRACHCLFGGGTAMALRYGEYRESVDIDFLVSDIDGYRQLREKMTGAEGVQAIARAGSTLTALREVRADQYGIRTIVEADGVGIKFEIVLEGRISLEAPGDDDQIAGIATLTPLDMAAGKLLANSDRWADDSVYSRDLIDLAMMQPKARLLAQAKSKAAGAYGASIDADLKRAGTRLLEREGRLAQCMEAMRMAAAPALVRQRIKNLLPKI